MVLSLLIKRASYSLCQLRRVAASSRFFVSRSTRHNSVLHSSRDLSVPVPHCTCCVYGLMQSERLESSMGPQNNCNKAYHPSVDQPMCQTPTLLTSRLSLQRLNIILWHPFICIRTRSPLCLLTPMSMSMSITTIPILMLMSLALPAPSPAPLISSRRPRSPIIPRLITSITITRTRVLLTTTLPHFPRLVKYTADLTLLPSETLVVDNVLGPLYTPALSCACGGRSGFLVCAA